MEKESDLEFILIVLPWFVTVIITILYLSWIWSAKKMLEIQNIMSVVDIKKYQNAEDLIESDPEKAIKELTEVHETIKPYEDFLSSYGSPKIFYKIDQGCKEGIDRCKKIIKKRNG